MKPKTLLKTKTILSILVMVMIGLVACQKEEDTALETDIENTVIVDVENVDDHDDPADYIWDESDLVFIFLNETSITIDGDGATSSGSVVNVASAGTYSFSGTLSDGQIIVNTQDDDIVRLILNGVEINCSNSSPIYVQQAEKTMIVLADGTENIVSDGTTYNEEDANAALYSADDLTIYGEGSLIVDANYNDGITSKDGLIITSGTISVNSVDDGIRGKDYLVVKNGNFTINAEGDGLKSDNDEDAAKGYISILDGTFNITSDGNAIQASTDVIIADGEFTTISGGGSNQSVNSDVEARGIKAGIFLTIYDGTFSVDAADDAIHSDTHVEIYNGTFHIASADDGIHANNNLLIDNGFIEIAKCYEGIESTEGNITINAGEIYLTTSDDGINIAAGGDIGGGHKSTSATTNDYLLTINGGYIVVNSNGDGIDSNSDVTINDGVVIVSGSEENSNSALDCDGTFLMNGGFLIATGTSQMADAPDTGSSQYSVKVTLNSTKAAGTIFHIQDSDGKDLVSFEPPKSYQSVVFSSPELSDGSGYDVYYGGSSTGTLEDGLYKSGTYSPGTLFAGFTISAKLTTVY